MRCTFSMAARLVTWGQDRLLTGQPPKDPGQRINSRSSQSFPDPSSPASEGHTLCFLRPCLSFWKPGVAAIIPQVPSPSAWPKEAGPEAPDSPAPPAKLPSPAPEALIRLSASALGQFVFPAGLLRSTPVCACLVALVMSNSL